MKVVIRADASLQIGTGHVMRCLTLADALAARGDECQFICREHQGNLIEFIRSKDYVVHVLPVAPSAEADLTETHPRSCEAELAHSHWLGASQAEDAEACASILADIHPDWLIVDHYALDARWERAIKPYFRKLMVIDDLADRSHMCDLLLDQTLGRKPEDYRAWVAADCRFLCGSKYALLRPEFATLRPFSLQRRAQPALHQLLITMGGVDKDNATGRVLDALRTCTLPRNCQITVVMGSTAPWLDAIRNQAQNMPWPTQVLIGVNNMAQLMADSDLAIGAAGATSWERCCLGLPTIMLVLAENQQAIASALVETGAVRLIGRVPDIQNLLPQIFASLIADPASVVAMSQYAAEVVDGGGLESVVQSLES